MRTEGLGKLGFSLLCCLILVTLADTTRAERLALLLGEDSQVILHAAEGVESLPGVEVTRFHLYRGINEVDEAKIKLRRVPFQAVVALGDGAHQFFRTLKLPLAYAATMVSHQEDSDLIPFEAPSEQWIELMGKLFVASHAVSSLAVTPSEVPALGKLRASLEECGRAFFLEVPEPGVDLAEAVVPAIRRAPIFFLARDTDLLTRKVLVRILKEAHTARVAEYLGLLIPQDLEIQ